MNTIFKRIQLNTDISAYSANFIQNLIQHRMLDLFMNKVSDYATYVESNYSELEKIESQLKNSFSQFFRNRLMFEVLGQVVLPTLISENREVAEIRIWSAGCAGGHEPYSLAMVFEKFNLLNTNKFKYRIFATDRDYHEIERAALGVFSVNDIGNLSNSETKKWFVPVGKNYKIKGELKKNIQFELFDLLNETCICPTSSIFGTFDFIMCANVLIYYKDEIQNQFISNFKKCLSKDGFVICGDAERDIFLNNNFIEVFPQSCIFKLD